MTKNSKKGKSSRKARQLLTNTLIYSIGYRLPIRRNLVYLESRDGKDLAGNILKIAQELSSGRYGNLKLVAFVTKKTRAKAKKLKKTYCIDNLSLITSRTLANYIMERAQYLVSDSGVPWSYVKREGQTVLNTWHGTPLKHMGRRIFAERHKLGTVQHLFLSSDFLLYPSEYMRDIMLDDYMLRDIAPGKVLMGGYPRNSVFFDKDRRVVMRKRLGCEEKRVFAYMPTWRGSVHGSNFAAADTVVKILSELDARMEDGEVCLAKLHPLVGREIDYAQFERIHPFPDDCETYDVLTATDCLVTDYSSVLFDFANTGRKIILYAYDENEYLDGRGLYMPLETLPFPVVRNIEDLLNEVRLPKEYDDTPFLQKYCPYDSPNATERLCRHVFLNESALEEAKPGNGRPNVLIMGGSLAKNGITSSLVTLLSSIDTEKRNYHVAFRRWEIDADPRKLDALPEGTRLLPLMSRMPLTVSENFLYKRYQRNSKPDAKLPSIIQRAVRREVSRCYPGIDFSAVVNFDGYGTDDILLFSEIPAANRVIFVHNDMTQEIRKRGFPHPATIRYAYDLFDTVAIVSDDLREPTRTISGRDDNIRLVHNTFDAESVRARARLPIELQPNTEVRCCNPSGIEGVLASPGPKIINVGRFSREKGHSRLINAFARYQKIHKDAQLIIIGGNGPMFERTWKHASSLPCYRNIALIKTMDNPMPILSRCDLFVLSSFYEGLPLVLSEADSLGIPVVATDIGGVGPFMRKCDGYLVPSTEDGVYSGMLAYDKGIIAPLNINYKSNNDASVKQFESLFKE